MKKFKLCAYRCENVICMAPLCVMDKHSNDMEIKSGPPIKRMTLNEQLHERWLALNLRGSTQSKGGM